MSHFRSDIQVLRGYAILLVLFYHAGVGPFRAGYLGVDIFFVISGYLITSLIQSRIEAGTFSFTEFYIRRAKRLLPAAYVTFFVVVLVAQFVLTSRELVDLKKQVIGAITLTGNIVLWRQTGYFEGEAEFKPLLHAWSLAIEEQYYLLVPAILVMLPRRWWLTGAMLVCTLSFVSCLLLGQWKPTATFYLLPTRSWELAIGSVGAFITVSPRTKTILGVLFWPSMIVLAGVPAIMSEKGTPGLLTLIVCSATLVTILRVHPVFDRSLLWRAIAKVGNISYSLYLVHWPLFAFINNAWIGEVPYLVKLACVGLALFFGFTLYYFVEKPFRQLEFANNGYSARVAVIVVSITSGLLLISAWSRQTTSAATTNYEFVRRVNHGFGEACEYNSPFTPKAECRNSTHPSVLVWGDSYAMHLVPGLVETSHTGIIQATRSVCGPMFGMAPLFGEHSSMHLKGYNREWSENCIKFNASVIEYLSSNKSVKIVVLSSPFGQYLDSTNGALLDYVDGVFTERPARLETAIDGLKRTIEALRRLGTRVIVVAPPPSAGFDIGGCLERVATNKVALGEFSDCQIPVSVYRDKKRSVLEFLDDLPGRVGVYVVRLDSYLCGTKLCKTSENGVFLYRDGGHLSYDGSKLLAQKINLSALVWENAR